MKKLFLLLLVLTSLIACKNDAEKTKKEDQKTVLSGKIDGFREANLIVQYLQVSDTIELSNDGTFSYELNLVNPTYINIINGVNNIQLYMIPNSNLNFTTGVSDFVAEMEISGGDSEINDYMLKQIDVIAQTAFNSAEFLFASDINVFLSSFRLFENTLNKNFDDFKQNHSDKNAVFVQLEQKRLMFLTSPLLMQYYVSLAGAGNIPDTKLTDMINQIQKEIDINNAENLKFIEFKNFITYYVYSKYVEKVNAENIVVETVEDYGDLVFGIIENHITDSFVFEEVYYSFLSDIVNSYGVNGMQKFFDRYKEISSNQDRINQLDAVFSIWGKLAPGQASADFAFQDLNGKVYTLADFAGKYLYIDVWATWCGPCIREIPHLNKLKDNMKGRNIDIVAISVDDKRSTWEQYVKTNNLGGIQLYADGSWNNEFMKFYMITGIPRFILIDRKGNIIDSNAQRPSGGVESYLLQLEGI
jgi:thiol-disulfide isomerase/thioredoxin